MPWGRRRQAVLAAYAPTARLAHLIAAGATVALASVAVLVAVARGDSDISTPLVVLAVGSGAAMGWAADNSAAQLMGAMPVSSPLQAALRVAHVAFVVTTGLMCIALMIWFVDGSLPDFGRHALEAGAAAAIALAVGFVAARRGERTAGAVGVTAGVLGPAIVAGLALRWPDEFPAFTPSPVHDRWGLIVALGIVVLVRAGRDPGRS